MEMHNVKGRNQDSIWWKEQIGEVIHGNCERGIYHIIFLATSEKPAIMHLNNLLDFMLSDCRLILNMLKDYKIYIHILNRILGFVWPKEMKLTLGQHYCCLPYTANTMPLKSPVHQQARYRTQNRNTPPLVSKELRLFMAETFQSMH